MMSERPGSGSLFSDLSGSAQTWTWVADRRLTNDEAREVADALSGFLSGWTSHGSAVRGEAGVLQNQIVLLAAEVPDGDVSGCGIDKSAHVLESVAEAAGFRWSSALVVPLVDDDDGALRLVPRAALRSAIADGSVGPDTIVVDRGTTVLGEIRTRGLLRPARETWLARYFVSDPTVPQ